MSNFIETNDGTFINIKGVRVIHPFPGGGATVITDNDRYEVGEGALSQLLDGPDPEEFSTVVPAHPGQTVFVPGTKPTLTLGISKHTVFAWLVSSEGVTPIIDVGLANDNWALIHEDEGTLEGDGQVFATKSAWIAHLLAHAYKGYRPPTEDHGANTIEQF